MKFALGCVERGLMPDGLVRFGIRRLLKQRLATETERFRDAGQAWEQWIDHMRSAAVAPVPEMANRQHYEVPAAFFEQVLGPNLKYSGAYWPDGVKDLGEAEAAMLALTCERAQLQDGQKVMELGCGWGSLSLWMAAKYPKSNILAVSNSATQRAFIEARAAQRGLTNLRVHTADMNEFDPASIEGESGSGFDRVVSVEMFEHMRNWEALLGRIDEWLGEQGKLFIHVFAHSRFAYPFDVQDETDWMAQYFFTGGIMPSDDLFERLDSPLGVEDHWVVNGEHYAKTAEAWCDLLERNRKELLPILAQTYGERDQERWFQRWKVFFLACAELFAYRSGEEWWVSHTLLSKAAVGSDTLMPASACKNAPMELAGGAAS